MKRLFIQLYLDEDVDVMIATLLRARGFSVTSALDAGNLGKSDAQQLEYAAEHHTALLTHNRNHFLALSESYYTQNRTHWGVLIARRRLPNEITRRLLEVLEHVTADEMMNQIRYI
jgi:uncharacterized membrane protein YgaE (UPF0421/DUF939 family)